MWLSIDIEREDPVHRLIGRVTDAIAKTDRGGLVGGLDAGFGDRNLDRIRNSYREVMEPRWGLAAARHGHQLLLADARSPEAYEWIVRNLPDPFGPEDESRVQAEIMVASANVAEEFDREEGLGHVVAGFLEQVLDVARRLGLDIEALEAELYEEEK